MRIKIRSTKADLPGRAAMWSRAKTIRRWWVSYEQRAMRLEIANPKTANPKTANPKTVNPVIANQRLRIWRLWIPKTMNLETTRRLWSGRLQKPEIVNQQTIQRLWIWRLSEDYESGDCQSNDYEARDCRFGRSVGFRSLELIFDMDVSDGNLSHFISLPACWDRRWNERGREWIQWERIDRKRRE